MKRISRGFDRDFIWHHSCLQINPATKLWFLFIPKVPFPWLQCAGISGRWACSEVKKNVESAMLLFDEIYFHLKQEKRRKNRIWTKRRLHFNRDFIVSFFLVKREWKGKKRVGLTERFIGWLVIKLQVRHFNYSCFFPSLSLSDDGTAVCKEMDH